MPEIFRPRLPPSVSSPGDSLPRFFCPFPLPGTGTLALPDAIAHHAVRVLRLGIGDRVILFDGGGGEHRAVLTGVGRSAGVELEAFDPVERESALAITLVLAVSAAERMDYAIQKATELGVSAIEPVFAARGVVQLTGDRVERRTAHWQRVAIAACEQCGRTRVPGVAIPMPLPRWMTAAAPASGTRVYLDPTGPGRVPVSAASALPIALAVGPEGGWADDEVALWRAGGFEPWRVGPRTLRAETAAALGVGLLQWIAGDLSGTDSGPPRKNGCGS